MNWEIDMLKIKKKKTRLLKWGVLLPLRAKGWVYKLFWLLKEAKSGGLITEEEGKRFYKIFYKILSKNYT